MGSNEFSVNHPTSEICQELLIISALSLLTLYHILLHFIDKTFAMISFDSQIQFDKFVVKNTRLPAGLEELPAKRLRIEREDSTTLSRRPGAAYYSNIEQTDNLSSQKTLYTASPDRESAAIIVYARACLYDSASAVTFSHTPTISLPHKAAASPNYSVPADYLFTGQESCLCANVEHFTSTLLSSRTDRDLSAYIDFGLLLTNQERGLLLMMMPESQIAGLPQDRMSLLDFTHAQQQRRQQQEPPFGYFAYLDASPLVERHQTQSQSRKQSDGYLGFAISIHSDGEDSDSDGDDGATACRMEPNHNDILIESRKRRQEPSID